MWGRCCRRCRSRRPGRGCPYVDAPSAPMSIRNARNTHSQSQPVRPVGAPQQHVHQGRERQEEDADDRHERRAERLLEQERPRDPDEAAPPVAGRTPRTSRAGNPSPKSSLSFRSVPRGLPTDRVGCEPMRSTPHRQPGAPPTRGTRAGAMSAHRCGLHTELRSGTCDHLTGSRRGLTPTPASAPNYSGGTA